MGNAPGEAEMMAMGLPALMDWQGACAHAFALARGELDLVNAVIDRRLGPRALMALAAAGKEDGQVSFSPEDGITARGKVDKRVKWDQGGLLALAEAMAWAEVRHYFKIELSMAEAIYKAIPPGPLKDAVTRARTVIRGEPRIALERAAA
jgi:hypothetical protein